MAGTIWTYEFLVYYSKDGMNLKEPDKITYDKPGMPSPSNEDVISRASTLQGDSLKVVRIQKRVVISHDIELSTV
jgi:hypothetical protein